MCTNAKTRMHAHKHIFAGDSPEEVQSFMWESVKMKMFDHPNVMNLLGVCLDAGPAPYIVLPFMSGGDLLSHMKGRQGSLVLECDAREETIRQPLPPMHFDYMQLLQDMLNLILQYDHYCMIASF